MSFTSFIGNWLFVLFAGVGLFALPIDLILEFVNRPVLRKSSEAMEIKNLLKRKTQALIDQGKKTKCNNKKEEKLFLLLFVLSIFCSSQNKVMMYLNLAATLQEDRS